MAKLDADSLVEVWRTHLRLPHHWNYPGAMSVPGTDTPAPAPAIMGDWVVIQKDGFLSSMEPFTIWAVNIYDSPFRELRPARRAASGRGQHLSIR